MTAAAAAVHAAILLLHHLSCNLLLPLLLRIILHLTVMSWLLRLRLRLLLLWLLPTLWQMFCCRSRQGKGCWVGHASRPQLLLQPHQLQGIQDSGP
jgi:hypothetical protein